MAWERRLTFVASGSTSMPLYLLSNCAVPLPLVDRIQRKFEAFLWRHEVGRRGSRLISWEKICKPKNRSRRARVTRPSREQRLVLMACLAAEVVLHPSSLMVFGGSQA